MSSWIIQHFPDHKIYVEPFCGAASVLLNKPRSRVEVLNDKYQRIVSAFRVIRDHYSELQDLLRLTPCSEVEYRAAREQHPDPVEDASRLIVLGHQAHGSTGASGGKLSGWRRGVRSHGQTSAREWAGLWEHVLSWADRLRGVYLECDDAATIIKRWDSPETLFYVDPPYVSSTRTTGLVGYAHEMTDDDHIALSDLLHGLSGKVVLSAYRSALYDELYGDWNKSCRQAIADKGKVATEFLWFNFAAAKRQRTLFDAVAL